MKSLCALESQLTKKLSTCLHKATRTCFWKQTKKKTADSPWAKKSYTPYAVNL